MKEDEEASRLRLTTDHDLHHRLVMMTLVLKFFGFSFPPLA